MFSYAVAKKEKKRRRKRAGEALLNQKARNMTYITDNAGNLPVTPGEGIFITLMSQLKNPV